MEFPAKVLSVTVSDGQLNIVGTPRQVLVHLSLGRHVEELVQLHIGAAIYYFVRRPQRMRLQAAGS